MKKIAVMPNSGKDIGLVNTKRLIEFLKDKTEIYMEDSYSVLGMNVNYVPTSQIYDNADYAIVLGGDGTILLRAAEYAKRKIPVMGINLGKIGFMTEIEIDDMEFALLKFLNEDFRIEKRMMLKAEIRRDNEVQIAFHALNDIVVSKSVGENLICIELSTDGEAVNRYNADGLIIATPTGSTGYSISAGGPVVDPSMRLLVATPICAHTLSARSAVLSSDKVMKIKLDCDYGAKDAVVTADGDVQGYIRDTDEVIITESEYDFELVKIADQSFYDTLIKKLS
ncbi:MAG: NAD(+)/NADH kinase [Oscillospiraceae bacterium]|nr:NAD(+)/NADH kinase [Oscillospiraceae bacterium]